MDAGGGKKADVDIVILGASALEMRFDGVSDDFAGALVARVDGEAGVDQPRIDEDAVACIHHVLMVWHVFACLIAQVIVRAVAA